MVYSKSGAVVKQCQRCGKIMEIENYFAACPTKYCKQCAADSKREHIAAYLREKRRKLKEQRKLEKEQNRLLIDENALLREQVRTLQYRVEALDAALRKR
jgi:late competence protein required for DNA uptake (superfamily II DNA/RNA helicase)